LRVFGGFLAIFAAPDLHFCPGFAHFLVVFWSFVDPFLAWFGFCWLGILIWGDLGASFQ
jgi:hypothetical protein